MKGILSMMNRLFKFRTLLLLYLIFLSISLQPVLAGNWSSGGGEILEHAQNPWFLETSANKKVTYCILVGEDFPLIQSQLEILIDNAIRWWQSQLSNAYYPENNVFIENKIKNLHLRINTDFKLVPSCEPNPDLSFQFGALDEGQLREFQKNRIDLTRYVALSIRTDYNSQLQGRGFIYVSPDRGPEAFRGQNTIKEAWTNQNEDFSRLQSVLIHELGHVFGLSHAGDSNSIMDARFAENIVSRTFGFVSTESAIFFPKTGLVEQPFCNDFEKTKAFREYFEIPQDQICFRIFWSLNLFAIEISRDQIYWTRHGAAMFQDGGKRRHRQLIYLWIPSDQKLFPSLPNYISSLFGPATSEVLQTATYSILNTNKTKSITIEASPQYLQLSGATNRGMIADLLPNNVFGQALSGWKDK